MPYADLGDMRMFCEDCGDPAGLPVVLLHGITQTGNRDWGQHYSSFSAR